MDKESLYQGPLKECFLVGKQLGKQLAQEKSAIKVPFSKSLNAQCPYSDPYQGNAWADGIIEGFVGEGKSILRSIESELSSLEEKLEYDAIWDAVEDVEDL